jgi:ribosomal protein S18 acetylase RimI-like enzyme
MLVLEDEVGLAGTVVGERWQDGVGYVAEVAVARRARGRGYGRALLLAMFAAFREAGLTKAELSVHGRNVSALGLYESVGMKPAFRHERWAKPAPSPAS